MSQNEFYNGIEYPLEILNQFISDLLVCKRNPSYVYGALLTVRKANELLGFVLLGYCKSKKSFQTNFKRGIFDRKGNHDIPKYFKDHSYVGIDGTEIQNWPDIVDRLIGFEKESISTTLHYQGYRYYYEVKSIYSTFNDILALFKALLTDYINAININDYISGFKNIDEFCNGNLLDSLMIDEQDIRVFLQNEGEKCEWLEWFVSLRTICLNNIKIPIARRSVWVLERMICECIACQKINEIHNMYSEFYNTSNIPIIDSKLDYVSEDYQQILETISSYSESSGVNTPDAVSVNSIKSSMQIICMETNSHMHFDTSNPADQIGHFFQSDRIPTEQLLNQITTIDQQKRFQLPIISLPIRKIGYNGFESIIVVNTGKKLLFSPPETYEKQLKGLGLKERDDYESEGIVQLLNTISASEEELLAAKVEEAKCYIERRDGFYFNSDIAGVINADPFFRIGADENPVLFFRVYQTDYYSHRVIERLIRTKLSEKDRQELAARLLPFGLPFAMRTSLGINLLIEMKKQDGSIWLFLTRRSSFSSYGEQNKIYLSVTETVAWDTITSDSKPIERTIQLGLEQELGIDSSSYSQSNIRILGSFFECNYFQDNIFAVLRIEENSEMNEMSFESKLEKSKDGHLEVGNSFWISKDELVKYMVDNRPLFREQAYFCLEWYIQDGQ